MHVEYLHYLLSPLGLLFPALLLTPSQPVKPSALTTLVTAAGTRPCHLQQGLM